MSRWLYVHLLPLSSILDISHMDSPCTSQSVNIHIQIECEAGTSIDGYIQLYNILNISPVWVLVQGGPWSRDLSAMMYYPRTRR